MGHISVAERDAHAIHIVQTDDGSKSVVRGKESRKTFASFLNSTLKFNRKLHLGSARTPHIYSILIKDDLLNSTIRKTELANHFKGYSARKLFDKT